MTPEQRAKETASTELTLVRSELAELEGWSIATDDDQTFAANMLRNVKARHKLLEATRTDITKPMNAALKAVNDLFRAPRGELEAVEKLLKSKIAAFVAAKVESNRAALEAARTADTVEAATEALATVSDTKAPKGVSVRHVWKVNSAAVEALPREFLIVDVAALEAYARKFEAVPPEIPGVTWKREAIVSSRAVS